jgi:hypothetical protein
LFGSLNEISETVKYLESHASGDGVTINEVLTLLRDDLRKELGLQKVSQPLRLFRFVRNSKK